MLNAARAGLCALVAGCALAGAPAAGAATTPPQLPPQGMYDACAPAQSPDACAGRLQRIGAAGFRAVMNGWVFNGGVSPERVRAYAAQAAAAGLQVIWPLHALPFQNADPNGADLLAAYPELAADCSCSTNGGLFAHLVSILRGLPNTWGYYLADEPSPSAHNALADWVARVRGLDPDHPRLIMGCGTCGGGDPGGASVSWMADLDIALGTDNYPVFGGPSDPARAYTGVANTVSGLDRVASGAGRNQIVALQAWRWGDSSQDAQAANVDPSATRFPSRDEIEAQRNAAIYHAHPSLVLWFTLTQVVGWEPGQVPTGWSNPPDSDQRWAALVAGAFSPVRDWPGVQTTSPSPAARAVPGPVSAGPRNRGPLARIAVRSRRVKRNTSLDADAKQSRDPDGRIVRYVWTLNGKRVTNCHARRCLIRVRRYGMQRLTLTVFDNHGATAVARRTIAATRTRSRR